MCIGSRLKTLVAWLPLLLLTCTLCCSLRAAGHPHRHCCLLGLAHLVWLLNVLRDGHRRPHLWRPVQRGAGGMEVHHRRIRGLTGAGGVSGDGASAAMLGMCKCRANVQAGSREQTHRPSCSSLVTLRDMLSQGRILWPFGVQDCVQTGFQLWGS